ncbi:MAG: RidA family protein [Flavobacteriales bacterium]|jgi:2-iminobutanoate/2-iminopropanoate deaminase|nr:RidA family protein [Flavobacteriales bacterium]MBT5932211.1 RidA family protein [Flavobacteriales bacterium]MDB4340200.1 RidA family protein [Crocinitomicaceae bacterium]
MSKKAIQIEDAPAPVGSYSQAILHGNLLFISGQIPLNPKTGQIEQANIQEATNRVMLNIKALIESAGMRMNQIVKCSIFLKDLGDFSTVNEIYSSYFNDVYPARETVEVSKLPLDVTIEISCIAVKDDK